MNLLHGFFQLVFATEEEGTPSWSSLRVMR